MIVANGASAGLGAPMTIARLAMDTRYEFCRLWRSRQVSFAQEAPVKGVEGSRARAR
jgi:hypothetical protein